MDRHQKKAASSKGDIPPLSDAVIDRECLLYSPHQVATALATIAERYGKASGSTNSLVKDKEVLLQLDPISLHVVLRTFSEQMKEGDKGHRDQLDVSLLIIDDIKTVHFGRTKKGWDISDRHSKDSSPINIIMNHIGTALRDFDPSWVKPIKEDHPLIAAMNAEDKALEEKLAAEKTRAAKKSLARSLSYLVPSAKESALGVARRYGFDESTSKSRMVSPLFAMMQTHPILAAAITDMLSGDKRSMAAEHLSRSFFIDPVNRVFEPIFFLNLAESSSRRFNENGEYLLPPHKFTSECHASSKVVADQLYQAVVSVVEDSVRHRNPIDLRRLKDPYDIDRALFEHIVSNQQEINEKLLTYPKPVVKSVAELLTLLLLDPDQVQATVESIL